MYVHAVEFLFYYRVVTKDSQVLLNEAWHILCQLVRSCGNSYVSSWSPVYITNIALV